MIAKIQAWLKERRRKKAQRIRRMAKRGILMADMHDFFAGIRTAEESLKWRDYAYGEIDKMTDDEILEMY